MKAHYTAVFCIAGLLAAAPSYAQVPADSPLAGIYECKSITDSMARLACYDSKVGTLEQREAKKEIVALDSTTAKTLEREAFGFSLPSLPKLGFPSFGGSADDSLEFTVKTVRDTRAGFIITLDNGQVWREVSGRLNYVPRGDLTAQISKGAMGSYHLSLSNGKERVRGLGVRRVE